MTIVSVIVRNMDMFNNGATLYNNINRHGDGRLINKQCVLITDETTKIALLS